MANRKGATKVGGRQAGTRNKPTRILKEAALLAAESIGEDGKGKDGLVGYLRTSALLERPAFLALLGKLLPLQVSMSMPQLRIVDRTTITFVENQALLSERIQAIRNGEIIKLIDHDPIAQGQDENVEVVEDKDGKAA